MMGGWPFAAGKSAAPVELADVGQAAVHMGARALGAVDLLRSVRKERRVIGLEAREISARLVRWANKTCDRRSLKRA